MTRFIQDLRDSIRGKFFNPFSVYLADEWLPTALANLSLWLKGDTIPRPDWNTPLYQQNDQSPEGNDGQLASGSGFNALAANSDAITIPSFTPSGVNSFTFTIDDAASNLMYLFNPIRLSSVSNNLNITTFGVDIVTSVNFIVKGGQYVIVINGASSKAYRNGVDVTVSATGTVTYSAISSLFTAGYSALIRGCRWISTTLTEAQALELYNNPQQRLPTGVDEVNLVRYYELSETSFLDGSIAFESSCRKLDLTDDTGYAIGQTVTVGTTSTKILGMVGSVIAVDPSFTVGIAAASITNGTNVTTIASVVEPQHGTFSTTGADDAAINGLTTGKQSLLSGYNEYYDWRATANTHVTLGDRADLELNDFTIKGEYIPTKLGITAGFIGIQNDSSNKGVLIRVSPTNKFEALIGNGTGYIKITSTTSVEQNKKFSFEVIKSGVNWTLKLNGVQEDTSGAAPAVPTWKTTPTITTFATYNTTVTASFGAYGIIVSAEFYNGSGTLISRYYGYDFKDTEGVADGTTVGTPAKRTVPGLHPTSITDLFGNAIQNHYIPGLFNGVGSSNAKQLLIGDAIVHSTLDSDNKSIFAVFRYNGDATQFLIANRNSGDGFFLAVNSGKINFLNEVGGISNQLLGLTTLTTGTWYSALATHALDGTAYLYLQELGATLTEDVPSANIGAPGDGSTASYIGGRVTSLPTTDQFNVLKIDRVIDPVTEGQNLNTYYLNLLINFSDSIIDRLYDDL
jgi:hypothetical protein